MKRIAWLGLVLLTSAGCATQRERSDIEPAADAALAAPSELVVADFDSATGTTGWQVENDTVMGGVSSADFSINSEGHAVFSGSVSLENGGGFASVQHFMDPVDVSMFHTACLRVKGDGKRYQFIVEAEKNAWHYYVYEFQTGQEWQVVEIPLPEMYAVRRGDRLGLPNFPGETLSMVRLLISNGSVETFRLEVDKIWLK